MTDRLPPSIAFAAGAAIGLCAAWTYRSKWKAAQQRGEHLQENFNALYRALNPKDTPWIE